MQTDWNITLFHYRNHGADYGRILVGIDVPEADTPAFDAFLEQLGYAFEEQTDNAAYKLFLSAVKGSLKLFQNLGFEHAPK